MGKVIWKKIQNNFTVNNNNSNTNNNNNNNNNDDNNNNNNNNNNKIIRAWYLSSKWPVCRSIVNQTTVGRGRTKFITLLKTNILKYCALFCSKVA